MENVVGHPRQSIPDSVGSAKRHEILSCSDGRQHRSDWPILDAFPQLLLLISPFENSTCLNSLSDFAEGIHNIRTTFQFYQILSIIFFLDT